MLIEINYYKAIFLHSLEILETTPSIDVQIHIIGNLSAGLWQYNAPFVNKITMIIPND
jgi:hypothetical protein